MTNEKAKYVLQNIKAETEGVLETAIHALEVCDKLNAFRCGDFCKYPQIMVEKYDDPYDAHQHLIEECCCKCTLSNL